jgi:hypothetical protein
MEVRIKSELKRSLSNHNFDIRNKTGYLLTNIGDGYCLIEFPKVIVKRKLTMEILQWYVHETDFYLTGN